MATSTRADLLMEKIGLNTAISGSVSGFSGDTDGIVGDAVCCRCGSSLGESGGRNSSRKRTLGLVDQPC